MERRNNDTYVVCLARNNKPYHIMFVTDDITNIQDKIENYLLRYMEEIKLIEIHIPNFLSKKSYIYYPSSGTEKTPIEVEVMSIMFVE